MVAKTKIKVTNTAHIKGNLAGAIIEVAEGAAIQGSINIRMAVKTMSSNFVIIRTKE